MKTQITFDESGFTGTDLTNRDQPFFVIASTTLSDAEARSLLETCFPNYQGTEFKFTNIWRRERHRANLRRLAEALPEISDRVFVWAIDKRFTLLIKLIDYLIEPLLYDSGYDFYLGGYCQRFVNTAHRDLLLRGSEALYAETAEVWDAFARSPSQSTFNALRTFLQTQEASQSLPLSNFFRLALQGLDRFLGANEVLEDFVESSEIQVTSMLSTVIFWRQQLENDFAIVHDESSSFFRNAEMWNSLMRNDLDPRTHQLGNGTEVIFPLRVTSTQAVSSHDSAAVQLCDLLAGLFGKMMRTLQGVDRDPFLMELVTRGVGDVLMSGVNPGKEYTASMPPRRDGPDTVDRMVEIMRPAIDRILEERRRRSSVPD